MKVFITGSTGLLGSALLRNAPKKIILGASFNKNTFVPNIDCKYFHVDITKKSMVNKAIKEFAPDVVIHTAAIATPDYCDKHQKEAWSVNVEGTKNLINACKKTNTIFVFITTNGVYDGKRFPYDEKSAPHPIDYYGETKYTGERLTTDAGLPYMIMRLITMYGWNNPYERQNPLTWLLDIVGKNKTPVNIVTDMYNNFLYVENAAAAIWKGVLTKQYGQTFNIAGNDCISRYEFSKKIAKAFNIDDTMIYPVTLDFFKNFVARPKNTCFVTKKMRTVLKVKPMSVQAGLRHAKRNLLSLSAWRNIV